MSDKELELQVEPDKAVDIAIESDALVSTSPEATSAAKPQEDVVVQKAESEPAPGRDDEALASLRQQLETTRKQARDAQRERDAARAEATDHQFYAVSNALDALETQRQDLKAKYKSALESSDFAAATEINDKLNETLFFIAQARDAKTQIEQSRTTTAEGRQIAPTAPADPVEAFASQLSAAEARDWIRSHPECVTDAKLNNRMKAAHYDAVDKGLRENSREYFAHIEARLGMRQDKVEKADEPQQESRAVAVAPVTRNAPTNSGRTTGPISVRLTPEEMEMASLSGLTPQEYARNKHALQQEGKVTRH